MDPPRACPRDLFLQGLHRLSSHHLPGMPSATTRRTDPWMGQSPVTSGPPRAPQDRAAPRPQHGSLGDVPSMTQHVTMD